MGASSRPSEYLRACHPTYTELPKTQRVPRAPTIQKRLLHPTPQASTSRFGEAGKDVFACPRRVRGLLTGRRPVCAASSDLCTQPFFDVGESLKLFHHGVFRLGIGFVS